MSLHLFLSPMRLLSVSISLSLSLSLSLRMTYTYDHCLSLSVLMKIFLLVIISHHIPAPFYQHAVKTHTGPCPAFTHVQYIPSQLSALNNDEQQQAP